ncbi:MAG: tripartite tricarboxylate transporter substrate binding protein [Burkholderiaceae bacterium]
MDSTRRKTLQGIGAAAAIGGTAAALAAATRPARAQAWPAKPPHAIVGFPAGGVVDVMARAVTDRMGTELGQPVVVEARPGAGANIAVEAVLAAPRDGYTWLVSSNFLFVNPAMDPAVKWKYEDFVPVARYALSPSFFLVPGDAPFATLADWVAHARRNPGVQYGNGGVGTTQSMSMAMLMRAAGVRLDPVYYKGAPQMMQDIVGGQLSCGLIPSTVAIPVVRSGRAKALATSGERRSPALPSVPTFAEAGYPAATALSWYGLHVAAGTPPDVVRRMARAAQAACGLAEVQSRLTGAGGEEAFLEPERFAAYVNEEAKRWLPLLAGEKKPGG